MSKSNIKSLILERLHQLSAETNVFQHYKYDIIRDKISVNWNELHDVELLDLFEAVIQKYYLTI